MSDGPNKARARVAAILVIAAVASTAGAAASFWLQRSATGDSAIAGKVLPGFQADMPQVRTITIASGGTSYNLVRRGTNWVMPERGDYPVSPSALSALAKGLSELDYKAKRTSDPGQFARLGVDDPRPETGGALISIKGATGQILDSLHIGQKEDILFVRKAGSNDVFEASGTLPELSGAAAWLDLKVLDVTPETIASVSGEDKAQARYDIVRRPDGGFAPVGGVANVTATTAAIALTKWAPIDVMAASSLTSDPIASHVTSLRSGVTISATAYQEGGRNWVVLSGDATSPDQMEVANKLNQRTDGWAFELSATDFADLTFTRAAVINGPG
jgi:Domain of unknown function (DUF4340)